MNKQIKYLAETPPQKTAAEHLEMLQQSIRLMLWHAFRWCRQHPEEEVVEVLEKRVDLFRRTEFHSGEIFDTMYPELSPEWQELKRSLARIMPIAASADDFEERGYELMEPFLEGRVERDLADLHEGRIFHQYRNSCLYFSEKKLFDEEAKSIDFHIANYRYPGSFFDDPADLPSCLLRMSYDAREKMGALVITTNSWLNSFEGWVRAFPPVWRERMGEGRTDTEDHLGFWGQFLTARQTFAYAVARRMRRSGELPYPMRRSWCTVEEMIRFLEEQGVER